MSLPIIRLSIVAFNFSQNMTDGGRDRNPKLKSRQVPPVNAKEFLSKLVAVHIVSIVRCMSESPQLSHDKLDGARFTTL